jgi:hypothetical protein
MTNLTKLIERRQGEVEKELLNGFDLYISNNTTEYVKESTKKSITEAYRQALLDLLAGLPGEVSVYLEAYIHMTDRELRDEEMRVFGMNYRLQTIRAQIEELLGKIE